MLVTIEDEGQRGALVQAFTDKRPADIGGVGGWKRCLEGWWTRVQGQQATRLLHHPLVQIQGGGEDGHAEVELDTDTLGLSRA